MSSIADVLSGAARWCLTEGDNADVLPTLADKSVAHVITDPPYEAEAHSKGRRILTGNGSGASRGVVSKTIAFDPMTEDGRTFAAGEIARLAQRWSLVFCQVEASQPWARVLASGGAPYIRTCVWVKPDGQPQLTGDRPGMGYESIVVCHPKGKKRWHGGGRLGVFVCPVNWDGRRADSTPHPTTKPLPLMLELVELFTDADDVVLDPFAGSGTTGVACLRLGRRFIGIEKDAKYAAVARERLEAETQGLTLRDARAGQQPLFPGGAP